MVMSIKPHGMKTTKGKKVVARGSTAKKSSTAKRPAKVGKFARGGTAQTTLRSDGSQQYTRGSTGPERLGNISRHHNLPDPRRIYSEEDVLKGMFLSRAFRNEADRFDAARRNERQEQDDTAERRKNNRKRTVIKSSKK